MNIQSGRVMASLAGHDDETSVEAVAFSRHLPHVAMSAGMDGRLILWDLAAAVASTRAICEHPDVRSAARAGPSPAAPAGKLPAGCSCVCDVQAPPESVPCLSPRAGLDVLGATPDAAARLHRLLGWRCALLGHTHRRLREAVAWPCRRRAGPGSEPGWQHGVGRQRG